MIKRIMFQVYDTIQYLPREISYPASIGIVYAPIIAFIVIVHRVLGIK